MKKKITYKLKQKNTAENKDVIKRKQEDLADTKKKQDIEHQKKDKI